MTRVWSGAVLVVFALAAVFLASPLVFFAVAVALLLLACREYAGLMGAGRPAVPLPVWAAAAVLACAAVGAPRPALSGTGTVLSVVPILLLASIACATIAMIRWQGGDALSGVAEPLFATIYLGLPIGVLVLVRNQYRPTGLFLLMVTVMVSDTAQYYSGRAFGRRPLAPAISPKKTIEGALGGLVAGSVVFAALGPTCLDRPAWSAPVRLALGVAIVAAGIAGDLFESMLKRSAGVKDSSALIPGHGGVLDRIDALLFAAPIYFVALTCL